MKITKTCLVVAFAAFLSISGCSKTLAPASYDASDVGKIKKVSAGTIISMRPINVMIKEDAANVDAPQPVGTHGFEYVIRLNSGAIVSVAQTENVQLKPKQRVLIIYGNNTRVVPDEGEDS